MQRFLSIATLLLCLIVQPSTMARSVYITPQWHTESSDFRHATSDSNGNLTDSYCQPLDLEMGVPEGILCQSVGSVMTKARSGAFPLNVCYPLVKHFSGENDGLVSEDSFAWGQNYTLLRATGKKGISHCDIIDLTRENIPGFDVREFYVDLAKDLKARGL